MAHRHHPSLAASVDCCSNQLLHSQYGYSGMPSRSCWGGLCEREPDWRSTLQARSTFDNETKSQVWKMKRQRNLHLEEINFPTNYSSLSTSLSTSARAAKETHHEFISDSKHHCQQPQRLCLYPFHSQSGITVIKNLHQHGMKCPISSSAFKTTMFNWLENQEVLRV